MPTDPNKGKSKTKDYWFPAKRFGWGWGPPIRWQGWVVLIVWLVAVVVAAIRLMPAHLGGFLCFVLLTAMLFLWICYAKGEPPAWRWGGRDGE